MKPVVRHIKKAGNWLKRNEYITSWVTAIPIISTWVLLLLNRLPPISVKQTNIPITYLPEASCVVDIKNESDYKELINKKCKTLEEGETLSIPPDVISQFVITQKDSEVSGAKIKKINGNCSVSFTCVYERTFTQTIGISHTVQTSVY